MKAPANELILVATERAIQCESRTHALTAFALTLLSATPQFPWLYLDWCEAEARCCGSAFNESVIEQALLKLNAIIPSTISDQLRALHPPQDQAFELEADDLSVSCMKLAGQNVGALAHPNRTDEQQASFYTCLKHGLNILLLHFAHPSPLRDVDPLSGLPGRSAFERAFQQALELEQRHAVSFCLAILDIDQFKSVNDQHGHAAGDEVIRALGQYLKGATRASDTVCRIGGDEFGMILPYANQAAGVFFAERIMDGLRAIKRPDGARLQVSMGMISSQHRTDLSEAVLWEVADKAMYASKAKGGDGFTMDPGA
ncbi:MAG: diguanylate cyclase (GGDEF)-like protein [Kiritimatiellia bacterium]